LEREIGRGRTTGDRGNGNERRSGVDNRGEILETEMQAHYKRTDVGVGIGIGAFMEKKSGNLDLKGRKASTEPVLSQNLAILLRPHLPALSRLPRSWTLVYSLDQHGISLNTLYTRCEEASSPSRAVPVHPTKADGVGLGTRGVLLIIKDDATGAAGDEKDEGVFGAWIADGEGFGMGKKGGKGYFGGGESFLWKYAQGTLKVYKTTGRNNYVALCEPGYISFGGGDGHYGLYLDDTLYDGSSAPCPTFDNEPLCSPGPKKAGTDTVEFECVGLEVWGMGP